MTGTSITVLALECSAGQASAAVGRNGTLLAESRIESPHGHAAWMVPLATEALEKSNLGFENLTHILAGRGPGSFTGIRVALAAAKGFALCLGIKAMGLSSLSALAASTTAIPQYQTRSVMSLIDTRRGSLFFQAFDHSGKPLSRIEDGDHDAVAAIIKSSGGQWVLAGHDALAIQSQCPDHDIVIAEKSLCPDAHGLIRFYDAMSRRGDALEDDHLEPLYLAAPLLGPPSAKGQG